MSRFLAIPREPVFSPGKVEADRAVLDDTAAFLRARGHAVEVAEADPKTWPEPGRGTVVFAMSQGDAALERLQAWEDRGVRVVNRPRAVLNCRREYTVAALAGVEATFPETLMVDTGSEAALPSWAAAGAVWVKRGDVHATEAGDVVRVAGEREVREALRRFRWRGIRRVALQRDVAGEVVKFYAVRGRFFFAVPPAGGGVREAGAPARIAAAGERAAGLLGVEVYGGDCVIGGGDGVALIDLNDWPSYGACRREAAESICLHLLDVG